MSGSIKIPYSSPIANKLQTPILQAENDGSGVTLGSYGRSDFTTTISCGSSGMVTVKRGAIDISTVLDSKNTSANPTLSGGETTLSSLKLNGTNYAVGGGSGKYLHSVWCGVKNTIRACFQIVTNSSTAFSSFSDIANALYDAGHTSISHALTATGYAYSPNKLIWCVDVDSGKTQVNFYYDSGLNIPVNSITEINDTVVAL